MEGESPLIAELKSREAELKDRKRFVDRSVFVVGKSEELHEPKVVRGGYAEPEDDEDDDELNVLEAEPLDDDYDGAWIE